MFEVSHSAIAKATRTDVWNVWQKVENWPSWDGALKSATLKSGYDFKVGAPISLELKSGQTVEVIVRELTPFRKYGNTSTGAFGETVNTFHEVEDAEDGHVKITHRITVTDLPDDKVAIFQQAIWSGIEKGWPFAVEGVKAQAEALALQGAKA
jgi:hypothetical protein